MERGFLAGTAVTGAEPTWQMIHKRQDRALVVAILMTIGVTVLAGVATQRVRRAGKVMPTPWQVRTLLSSYPEDGSELFPTGIAVDAEDSLFVVDLRHNQVIRMAPDGTATLAAGTGEEGFSGDGGPAVRARLNAPWGIALDRQGNLFIADRGNQRIRKVSRAGIISTVAGSGPTGFSHGGFAGDGGPAIRAQLNAPRTVALDRWGDLFIADSGNKRVRRVDRRGRITTVAGTGRVGHRSGTGNGDYGPATQADLMPMGVTVDAAGDLLIVDLASNRVREVSQGMIISVAGMANSSHEGPADGKPEFFNPNGVAVDAAGNLLVSDTGNNRVCIIRPMSRLLSVIGSGPHGEAIWPGCRDPRNAAATTGPYSAVVDRSGNVFIAEALAGRVREVLSAAAPGLLAGQLFPAHRGAQAVSISPSALP